MAILRNKRKLAAMNRKNHEDLPRNNRARNTNSPKIQEEYITQVSEKIEGRMTNKLSQELSKTESRILYALSRLDDFLQNPHARAHSGPVPETSRNISRRSQRTNGNSLHNDPHPEVGVYLSQNNRDLSPE